MNKTHSQLNNDKNSQHNLSCHSIGIGQFIINPYFKQETMQWTAIYMEGKFYLADAENIRILQDVQQQIELQKKLVNDYHTERDRAESVRDLDFQHESAEYSCVTEVNPQRQTLAKMKVQNQLEKQEEMYVKRLEEAKIKKKEEKKKTNKNLIKVNHKINDDVYSQKMEKAQKQKGEQHLGLSMMGKTPMASMKNKNAEQSNQLEIKLEKPQSVIKSQKVSPQSIIFIKIESPKLQAKLQYYKQASVIESQIIKNLKEVQVDEEKQVSILNLKSDLQHQINEQIKSQQRAGNSFFYRLHNDMAQLQKNINKIDYPNQTPQYPQNHQFQQNKSNSQQKRFEYQQTSAVINTKKLLKELNLHLREIGMIEPEQDSQASSQKPVVQPQISQIISKKQQQQQKEVEVEVKKDMSYEPILKDLEERKSVVIQNNTQKHTSLFTKKKNIHLSVMPSTVNYQIVQNQPKIETSSSNVEQKQKLNQQITILKQVIGELRVQRLKYQINMNSRLMENNAEDSKTVITQRSKQQKQSEQTPTISNKLASVVQHRQIGSIFNNFTESIVSQFNSSLPQKSLLGRSLSGRIMKNYSPQKRMTKIMEQIKQQTQEKQIFQQNNEDQQKQESKVQRQYEKAVSVGVGDGIAQPIETQQLTEKSKVSITKKQQSSNNKNSTNIEKQKSSNHEQVGPVTHNSEKCESDLQSSMPRHLIKNNNRSNPPKFIIQDHQNRVKKHETNIKKKLLDNFQQLQKHPNQNKYSTLQPDSNISPRRRASRQGLLKNIEFKTSHNPQLNQLIKGDTNIKKKIFEGEQSRQSNIINTVSMASKGKQESKSNKGFRLRRESQSSRNSRVSYSNKSSKSCECKSKKSANNVYVPALSQLNFQNNTPKDKDKKIYQIQFQMQKQKSVLINNQGISLQNRKIMFSDIIIPQFPSPPTPNISVEQMVELIKKISEIMDMNMKEGELHKLVMKKYKNCIMLDLPHSPGTKLVWHYTGKLYIGEWSESIMLKSGEGIQYVPDKYYYKGQFLSGKRNGTGCMLQPNGNRYEGQWLDGERNGRGKYYDQTMKLYYEGEWKDSKREGYGYLRIQEQSTFQGTFVANSRHGYGTQIFSNGDSYKGEYQKGRFHGKGVYVWSSGAKYDGNFFEGCKHGQGKWKSQIGQIYVGEYQQDKKNGKGRYLWENGCIFQGQFSHDKKNGSGILKYPDGRQIKGIWKDGQLIETLEQTSRHTEGKDQPLVPRKSKVVDTMTIIKVVESKPNKFSTSAKLSNF